METKRLFIAIPLPQTIQAAFSAYLLPYKKIPARWVEEKNYHITALFLGYIEVSGIDELKARLGEVCKTIKPFTLQFDRICFFPDQRRPHMIWASFGKHSSFSELLLALEIATGKENDKEELPHVTLARLHHFHLKEKITFPPLELPPLEVTKCELFASTLTNKSPIYTLLESFHLGSFPPGGFPPGAKFTLLAHTADMRLRAEGNTLEELFSAALAGMTSLLASPSSFTIEQKIELTAKDPVALLVDFLSEVLTRSHIQKAVFGRVQFFKLTGTELVATIFGSPCDHFDRDVKAVTYHEAAVEKTASGTYEARMIFDI